MNIPPHIMLQAIQEARDAGIAEAASENVQGPFGRDAVDIVCAKLQGYVEEWAKMSDNTEAPK